LIQMLDSYDDVYWQSYYTMMSRKLGWDALRQEDIQLINDLEKMMTTVQPDMTIFYRLLIHLPLENNTGGSVPVHFNESFYKELSDEEARMFFDWIERYAARRKTNTISLQESVSMMEQANPHFILRNYLLHRSIEDLEKGDDSLFVKLQEAMKDPYAAKQDEFFQKRPLWANEKAGCSMLSCSS